MGNRRASAWKGQATRVGSYRSSESTFCWLWLACTVEIHRANMLTKMGAQHTSEAIRVAIEASLVG